MTQQQVAGERYTKAYISALENGLVRPSVAALEYLAQRLGTTASALMTDSQGAWTRLDVDLQLAAGNWQAAADGYRALIEGLPRPADRATRAELLRGEAEALARLDRGAEAAAAASESVELFEKLGREADAALASYWLSAGIFVQGNAAESKAILQAVLGRLRAGLKVEPDFKLRVLMALSSTESLDGNHHAALAYLEEIRALADTLDDRRRATYLFDLAYSYCETGDYEAAIRTGYASLALYSAAETSMDMARLENELAIAHMHTGNTSKAMELALSSEQHFAQFDNDRQRAHVLDTIAQIELAAGNGDAAIERANAALALAESIDNPLAAAGALTTLARVHVQRTAGGDGAAAKEALAYFERAAQVCRAARRPAWLRAVLTEWADFMAARGDHQRAFELTREALSSPT